MKLTGLIGTGTLSLLLALTVPAHAQEQHDQQDEPKDRAVQQDDKNAKPDEKNAERQGGENRPEEKSAQQHPEEAKPEQPAQHAAGNGHGRIPDDRFRANFGREHTFHVSESDYRGRRFQYGGYSFGFVGAWPANWQYTQDVYVVDINGVYYLCNPAYPGVNIALSLTL